MRGGMPRWWRRLPLLSHHQYSNSIAITQLRSAAFCSSSGNRASSVFDDEEDYQQFSPYKQQGAVPSLKSELRRLFKLVHPDFFYSHPDAQAVNQESFRLLMEYLNVAKGTNISDQYSYQFIFYLKSGTPEILKKVEVVLPRPQIQYIAPNRAEINPATREALGNLLFACGLSKHVAGGLISEDKQFRQSAETRQSDELRLSVLFSKASEILRQNETCHLGFEQKIVAAKNALCVGRGIRVSFASLAVSFSLTDKYVLLHKVGKALDLIKDINFRGHSLMIGDRKGVDSLGNIWVNYEESAEEWSTFLATIDLKAALKYKKDATLRRALEFKVAKLMEVEMVYTHDSLAVHPYYLKFLNEIAEGALCHGAVADGRFHKVPIKVIGNPDEFNVDRKEFNPMSFEVDQTMGYVSVPVWENIINIYAYIRQHGEEALSIRNRFRENEEQMESIKARTRKSLKLRHLHFDKNLSKEKCISACNRLLKNTEELVKYMEGLSVCISHENVLPQEGYKNPMLLKWDFNISKL